MMTHIISELPESYKKIVENPKDKLDEIYNPMTNYRVFENLFVKLLPDGNTSGNEGF